MATAGPRLLTLAATVTAALAPAQAAPRVAADIAPVHAITARVMAGIGSPALIIPPGASEHDYAMRPSEAKLLQDAELVVWIGPVLTPWLSDPLDALAADARRVTLAEAPGVLLLPVREEGPLAGDAEAHADDHADADDHAEGEAHDDEHGHDHAGGIDPHLWLDPANAAAFGAAIAAALAEADPANAAAYSANADVFEAETAALADEIDARLAPVRGRPFLVFHDAYQYFEARFAIPAAGSVALSEAEPPSAAHIAALRDEVRRLGIACAFAEPQHDPKILATVTEGTGVRTATLDPVGAALPPGPGLYPALLRGLADSLAGCLAD